MYVFYLSLFLFLGCKIKALRAKTNTYIKTPVRGEEPVFVVTGRKEDVAKAKREILSAAEHFSLIRASRKPAGGSNGNNGGGNGGNGGNGGGNNGIVHLGNGGCLNASNNVNNNNNNSNGNGLNGSVGVGGGGCGGGQQNGIMGLNKNGNPPGPPANIPGQITIQVRVPYRVVGLVVGPKGATIKHIQQQTHTYIVTPSRDKEPVFEVTGQPDNVQSARRQIEAHIALRTGNSPTGNGGGNGGDGGSSTASLASESGGLGSLLGEDAAPELLASLYKNGFSSLLNGYLDQDAGSMLIGGVGGVLGLGCNGMGSGLGSVSASIGGNGSSNSLLMSNGGSGGGVGVASVSTASSSSAYNSALPSSTGSSSCDNSSASDHSSSSSSSSSSTSSKSAIISRPELMNIWKSLGESIDLDEGLGDSPNIWSMSSGGIGPLGNTIGSGSGGGSRASPASPIDSMLIGGGAAAAAAAVAAAAAAANQGKRECLVCGDKEVTAALVPCGHNMFCLECANRICGAVGDGAACPICSQTVVQAIRIIA